MGVLISVGSVMLRLIARILYYSGIIFLLHRILNATGDRKAIILLYHRVTDGVDFITEGMGGYHTSMVNFEKHIRFLKKNYSLIPLKELISILKTKGKNYTTYITITFDDGYQDNYMNAFPILKRYNVPATVFLMTDYVSGNRLMWRHRQHYYKYYKQNIGETEETVLADRIYLNWHEVKTMYEDGLDIGAHTRSHFALTQLSLDQARKEIIESKNRLEQMLGIEVKTFAYPFGRKGDFNEEIKEIVKEEGLIGACSTIEGINSPKSDPYALKRICLGNQSVSTLALKLLFYELTCR